MELVFVVMFIAALSVFSLGIFWMTGDFFERKARRALVLLRGLPAARAQRRRDDERLRLAFAHASSNRDELSRSDMAGCAYCLYLFNPQEEDIEYGDHGVAPDNACCPRCDLHTVVGSASGYPITLEFMAELNDYVTRKRGTTLPGWVLNGALVATALAVVLAGVFLFLSLPWYRVLLGLFGLASVASGVGVLVTGKIGDEDDPSELWEGGWATVIGILSILAGALIAIPAFFFWDQLI